MKKNRSKTKWATTPYNGKLTLKDLENYLLDIFKSESERPIIVSTQWCKTNGFVNRSTLDLQLCSDPECKSCSMFHNEIKKVIPYER